MLDAFIKLLTLSLKQASKTHEHLVAAREEAGYARNNSRAVYRTTTTSSSTGNEIQQLHADLETALTAALRLNEQIQEKTAAWILMARS
jgi:hypothetical protein